MQGLKAEGGAAAHLEELGLGDRNIGYRAAEALKEAMIQWPSLKVLFGVI